MSDLEEDDNLLARWLDGTLSPEELKNLEQHPDFPAYKRIVEAADRLALPDAKVEEMWQKMDITRAKPQKALWRPLYLALAVAAAIGGLLFVFWPFAAPVPDSVPVLAQTGIGEKKEITLPDGSKVQLNVVSEISYDSSSHWESERLVHLKGEAWFDVQKTGKPFKIETEMGAVEVLGTTFSVLQRQGAFEVACYTGRVRAICAGDALVLQAGQKSTVKNKKWEVPRPISPKKPDWQAGVSKFENAQLRTVFDEMERYYKVTISLDPGLENKTFSGEILHNDLEFSLKVVCQASSLQYEVNGQKVLIKK